MTSYACFEELEASVPMPQLRPSVAFSRCAAHLPHDVDQLHGDELVQSMEKALSIHSKARVVLQCWVLLIMRRRVDARHEKDALYDRLQQTTVGPQEKIRYRRGAMLLCHLLIERDAAEADSLLDRYLVDFYFPWSSAVNDRDDTFYLQADVVHWVRQAFDHLTQNGSKMTATRWRELSRSSSSPASISDAPAPLTAHTSTTVEPTPASRCTRSKDADRSFPAPPLASPTQTWTPRRITHKKRRRTGASFERLQLESLQQAVERWAKRLRRELLQAALADDKERIHQVADELQAPPLLGKAMKDAREQGKDEDRAVEDEIGDDDYADDDDNYAEDSDDDQGLSEHSTSADSDDSSSSSSNATVERKECTVCEADPKRTEQVWNASCGHGFCGDCMLARLSQRERRCMYCRAKITQVVDGSGKVFQHFDWTRWWRTQGQVLSA